MKKTLKYYILFLTLLQTLVTSGQEEIQKNSLYVSMGTVIFSNQVSVAYERNIFSRNKARTNFKIGAGTYLSNNADYETGAIVNDNYFNLGVAQLINKLELNAGLAYTNYKKDAGFNPVPEVDYDEQFNRFQVYANIGVRLSKKNFLFRAGVGNLELLYLGLGFNF